MPFDRPPEPPGPHVPRGPVIGLLRVVVTGVQRDGRDAHPASDHAAGYLEKPRDIFNHPRVAHLVAFKNCTVDLRTGERMDHDQTHYMTGCLQCDYDETADLDRILRTFARFWPNDPDTARCFQTTIGYCITAETSAKRVVFLLGNQENDLANGDNGKSLVTNALLRMFGIGRGGWGTAIKPSIIIDTGDRDVNSHDGGKTPLVWKRFAMASEPRKGSSIDSGEFNRISGGDEQMVRPTGAEDSIQFVNFATLVVSMNTVIRFKAWDKAIRVRLTPFQFLETFYDPGCAPEGCQEKELGLKEWLESDDGQRALALYAVRGAMTFYAENGGKAGNFKNSRAVEELRDKILADANPYGDMFDECFVFDPTMDTPQNVVSALLMRHLGHRPKPHERDIFIDALKGCNVLEVKIRGDRYWRGVKLTAAGYEIAASCGYKAPCVRNTKIAAVAAE
ncbi:hypothetical protein DDV93_13955 [Cereibacter johrii]|nr:hypothetical protein DDV93_13955 [Cereibacter johrii]